MARPTGSINPKSIRQLAIKNGLNPSTVAYRLCKMNLDKIDALATDSGICHPKSKLTDQQIIECEKLGLSINRSAYVLGVHNVTLSKRIKKLGLTWRGKSEFKVKK